MASLRPSFFRLAITAPILSLIRSLTLRIMLCLSLSFILSLPLPHAQAQQSPDGFDEVSRNAGAAREQGDIGKAITLYAEATELNPSWQDGWWYLGALQYQTGAYAAALAALSRFLELNPSAGPAMAMRGLCEYETGEYLKALRDIESGLSLGAANQPRNKKILRYHEAMLLVRVEKFDDAMRAYAALAPDELEPVPEYLLALGLAALRIPLLPKEVPPEQRDLLLKAGDAVFQFMAGSRELAARQFEDLFRQSPVSRNAHYAYGYLLYPVDFEEAAVQFRLELATFPSNAPAAVMLAWILLMQERPSEALPIAEEAVAADSTLPGAQLVLGRSQLELGKTVEGMAHLESALRLEPENLEARLALVTAYSRLGRKQDARRERLRCIQMADANARRLAHL